MCKNDETLVRFTSSRLNAVFFSVVELVEVGGIKEGTVSDLRSARFEVFFFASGWSCSQQYLFNQHS